MLFSVAFGVPEKSVFTRLFCIFATDMLANFQASINLRMELSCGWYCLYRQRPHLDDSLSIKELMKISSFIISHYARNVNRNFEKIKANLRLS